MKRLQQCFRLAWFGFLVFGLLILATDARAQSKLDQALKQFNATDVQGYIQPLTDLFGANMNTGYYHSAAIGSSGFHIALDFIAMGAQVGDDQKTYIVTTPPSYPQLKSATVFGDKAGIVASAVDPTLQYKGIADGILNPPLFPLATPQLTIGNIYGTQMAIRFVPIPASATKDLGSITLFGLGVRHSVSQYFPDLPVDIAGGFFYNRFSVGDLITFNSVAFGAQASKQFSVLALYGGLQYEKSTMNLTYNSASPTATSPSVDISMDGANKFRFTVGAGLDLAVFHLFADANFGSITNFSAGFGFGGY
jgi:hypothetical protein